MNANPFLEELATGKLLIGMLHLPALPGTPCAAATPDAIVQTAVREAAVYRDCGVHTVLIENMHDVPYVRRVGPETVAVMTRAVCEVRGLGLCVGVQVLAGANREAVAVAAAGGAAFVRVEGYVYAHVADEGLLEACAGELLRYRRQIGAEGVAVLADIKKKHCAHAITADVDLGETARTAAFFRADGVIVSGRHTGEAADPREVAEVRRTVTCPVLVGSGVTPENVAEYLRHADGLIVGSWVKVEGHWSGALCRERVRRLVSAFEKALG
ncbi:MAG: BtpA/SgcQ family protein [Lentisphaeria bacterium]|nr:BtpA/SgcQ family protein [Lentisphaeria bacterium]